MRADCRSIDEFCDPDCEIEELVVEYWACWLDSFATERLELAFSASKAFSREIRSDSDGSDIGPSWFPRTVLGLRFRLD